MRVSVLLAVVFFTFVLSGFCVLRNDQDYWKSLAQSELSEALKVQWNLNTAKNVILFIGDGMGPNTVTATRIYKGGETHSLVYEKFPHIGMLKTYSADKMVPDSACTATALFCGVKVNQETVGVDGSVTAQDCPASLRSEARLSSLAADALKAGKSAGFVTTMRVTHATPAPLYAHSASRSWECDDRMPSGTECKDIARQLVEDWPGRDLQVILGGGRQMLVSNSTGSNADPIDTWSCRSQDGRNLIETYIIDKEERGLGYSYVTNNEELSGLDFNETDYLFGIFANSHLKYEFERDQGPQGMPSIVEMTEAAIKVLQKNDKGYFLMVEGGNVDMAHHRGRAKTAINESAAFEDAVRLAVSRTDEADTLIVVTADHTHTLSINGYQDRGSDIFGIAAASPHDHINYTTLSYGTGGPGSNHYYSEQTDSSVKVSRRDPSLEDTKDFYYEQVAGITLDENSHGGGDVTVYAKGPYSHLFHNIHEQHYVYHAVAYAAKIGEYQANRAPSTSGQLLVILCIMILELVRMELPVLDKFCFIFDLRTGCIVMGIINSVLTFVLAVILITLAVDIKSAAQLQAKRDDGEAAMSSVVYTIVALLVALLFIKFVLDLVFVYAVHKEKCGIMKKYCIFWIIFLVLFIIGFLKTLFHMDAGHVIAQILFLAENFYYISIIRSYLISINEDGVL